MGVVADDDHHRRDVVLAGLRGLHGVEALLPLRGQHLQGGLGFTPSGFGLRLAADQLGRGALALDVLPEMEELRAGLASLVFDREAGNLGQAGLDGVHQAEIRDEPGEGRAFDMPRAAEVERRGGKIDANADADRLVDAVEAFNPDRSVVELFLVRKAEDGAFRFVFNCRLGAIRMVGFVVQDHDFAAAVEFLEHAAGEGIVTLFTLIDDGIVIAALGVRGFRMEDMPVSDDDFANRHEAEHVVRHHVELGIVVRLLGVGLEHLEALFDRQVGTADQNGRGKARVAGDGAPIAERPGDEHPHDDRLTGAGRHLTAVADQGLEVRVVRLIGQGQRQGGRGDAAVAFDLTGELL